MRPKYSASFPVNLGQPLSNYLLYKPVLCLWKAFLYPSQTVPVILPYWKLKSFEPFFFSVSFRRILLLQFHTKVQIDLIYYLSQFFPYIAYLYFCFFVPSIDCSICLLGAELDVNGWGTYLKSSSLRLVRRRLILQYPYRLLPGDFPLRRLA